MEYKIVNIILKLKLVVNLNWVAYLRCLIFDGGNMLFTNDLLDRNEALMLILKLGLILIDDGIYFEVCFLQVRYF